MPMYNLIEYSNNYWRTFGSLWQYYRDEPDFLLTVFRLEQSKNNSKTSADGNTKDVKKPVPLIYLSKFWRTPRMPLISCEINLILIWSKICAIFSATGKTKFSITDTDLLCLSRNVINSR